MRLDFNVLWVDDQPSAVVSQITRIKSQMENEGFRFNPTQCKSLEEVETHIAEGVFQDEIDLILVDWDLGGGVKGQNVISRVREVAQYKDVVFYSARTPANDLRKMTFDEGLEGIYCASREDLVEEVFGVFESLVKKVLDLDHTRGIVMGATSDIDHMVLSCLICIEAKLDETDKRNLLTLAMERVRDRVKDVVKQGEKLERETFSEILKSHMIFGANDRLRLLSRLLNDDATYAQSMEAVKDYMQNVVPRRNELGHLVLAPEGKPTSIATTGGKPVGLAEMRDLRKAILRLREDFRALTDALNA